MTAITSISRSALPIGRSQGTQGVSTANRSYPVLGLSGWQISAFRKIAALSVLPVNWDSYGSVPIQEDVLDVASDLVSGVTFDLATSPRVIPVAGGGVQLEWSKGLRELIIRVCPDLTLELAARDGQTVTDGSVGSLPPAVLQQLLSWLESA